MQLDPHVLTCLVPAIAVMGHACGALQASGRLKGGATAARLFFRPACMPCQQPEWHLRTRNPD